MGGVRCRVAGAADRPEVEALLGETYPALLAADYASEVMAAVLPVITRIRDDVLCSGSYFVARAPDGLALAAGGWTREAPKGGVVPGLGHVRFVVTRLGRTGEGIGRALMAHVMEDARREGMARLDCLSTLTAVRFYEALGFRRAEAVDLDFGGGVVLPTVRLVRELG